MKIHQITDLHIPPERPADDLTHIRPNVQRQLAYVRDHQPDLLVISGDLTWPDHLKDACEWLCALLPDVPVAMIPGNHDDPAMMFDIFGESRCIDPSFCYKQDHPDGRIIYVNTQVNALSQDQMAQMKAWAEERDSILFIHHPPSMIGGGFMDRNYPLENHLDASAAIAEAGIEHVFCGHYHNQKEEKTEDGFTIHLTPSPAFQISLSNPDFEKESFDPVVRIIDYTNGQVSTELVTV
ncbi:MAG: metallophosphoesterase [Pseudomonadota bacterium]